MVKALSGTGRDTGNVRTCIGLEDYMSHDDVDNKEDAESAFGGLEESLSQLVLFDLLAILNRPDDAIDYLISGSGERRKDNVSR